MRTIRVVSYADCIGRSLSYIFKDSLTANRPFNGTTSLSIYLESTLIYRITQIPFIPPTFAVL